MADPRDELSRILDGNFLKLSASNEDSLGIIKVIAQERVEY